MEGSNRSSRGVADVAANAGVVRRPEATGSGPAGGGAAGAAAEEGSTSWCGSRTKGRLGTKESPTGRSRAEGGGVGCVGGIARSKASKATGGSGVRVCTRGAEESAPGSGRRGAEGGFTAKGALLRVRACVRTEACAR